MSTEKLKGKEKVFNNQASHWIVTPTFWCASNLFTFMFMLLIALGYFFFYEANKLNEEWIRYDDRCETSRQMGIKCKVEFTPAHDLVRPKVYYRLTEFYHNHRSFVKSRDFK